MEGGKMKTVEEFYKEIMASKELREELKKASDEMMEAFLKQHGCNADAKEFMAFVRAQSEGTIDDDAAATIAGGAPIFYDAAGERSDVMKPL